MVQVAGGLLRLNLARPQAGSQSWDCGEIQTHATYQYGTFEARIRSDQASGANAAFFTYIGPVHGQSHDEIDVEILTRDTAAFDVNMWRNGRASQGARIPIRPSAHEGFRTYSFIWEPDRIRWFVDGVLVHTATGADVPQTPQKIYMSHWNSQSFTDWMGPFIDPGRTLTMQVDWIAWTPLGRGCVYPGSVLCRPSIAIPRAMPIPSRRR